MAHVSGNPAWTNTVSTPVNATALENIEANGDFALPTLNAMWLPSNQSLLTWSFDGMFATTTFDAVPAQMGSVAIPVGGTVTATGLACSVNTGNASLTSGQNYLGLYNASGALVGSTGDQTTAWASAGNKAAAFSGGTKTLTKGVYYAWFLVNMSSGTVKFLAAPYTAAANYNTSGQTQRTGYINGSGNTALPSTAPNPAGFANALWIAIY